MMSSAKSKGGEEWSVWGVWGDFVTAAAGIDPAIPGIKRNALLIFLYFGGFGSGSEHQNLYVSKWCMQEQHESLLV